MTPRPPRLRATSAARHVGMTDIERAAQAYGFVTMPDPVTLYPEQLRIIEGCAAALAAERQKARAEAIEECEHEISKWRSAFHGDWYDVRLHSAIDGLLRRIRALAAPGAPEPQKKTQTNEDIAVAALREIADYKGQDGMTDYLFASRTIARVTAALTAIDGPAAPEPDPLPEVKPATATSPSQRSD